MSNGLTYYIRHNNWPEKRASFYIAQKVGSLQEEESQRGLAHFLEHMCFNGTDHFKGNDLIRYCESLGVQFGADLNAYTSIDETVYNISNVPTTRQTALDSCLLILRDWATGLTLDPKKSTKNVVLFTKNGVCAPVLKAECSKETYLLYTQEANMAFVILSV